MKRFAFLGCIAAAVLSFVSCDEIGNEGYEGINYIYLSSEGDKTTILESDQTPLSVEVMLTTALEEDITITFAVNGIEGVVELQNNPVTIKAGEKTASFQIVSLNAGKLSEAANFKVGLDAAAVLPEDVELKSEFAFVVNPAPAEGDLTPEQLEIIDAYKTATGVDLSKYLGTVSVSAVVTGTDPDTYEPLEPQTITGVTVIELSDDSTADAPVLKMTSNAMGIQDYMYNLLRSVTVADSEFWCDAESYPDNANLMAAINWNADSDEVFTMSLDGITLNADKTVDFLGAGLDQYEGEIVIVPFAYEFTAYEREKVAVEAGTFVRDEYAYDATANPYYHMNFDDVTEDLYEGGNWVEASAEISNDSLVFTFCFYGCYLDGDYTRVVATYTPNN